MLQVLPPESGASGNSVSGSASGLTDEAGEVTGGDENIGQDRCLGTIVLAMPGGAFHATARLVSIATFGITQASDAQFPGRGTDLEIACEADVAIR